MAPDEPSNWEMWRRIEAMDQNHQRQFNELRNQIAGMTFVHTEVYERDRAATAAAIKEINDRDARRIGWVVTGILMPTLLLILLAYLQLK